MAKQLADQALSAKLKSNTSADRLQLLATMADIRGSLGLGLANLRAFLLTGDARFSDRFKKFWAVNEKRWADLRIKTYLLTDEAELPPLPEELLARMEVVYSTRLSRKDLLLLRFGQ